MVHRSTNNLRVNLPPIEEHPPPIEEHPYRVLLYQIPNRMSRKKWEKQKVLQDNLHFWGYSLCVVISPFIAEIIVKTTEFS